MILIYTSSVLISIHQDDILGHPAQCILNDSSSTFQVNRISTEDSTGEKETTWLLGIFHYNSKHGKLSHTMGRRIQLLSQGDRVG